MFSPLSVTYTHTEVSLIVKTRVLLRAKRQPYNLMTKDIVDQHDKPFKKFVENTYSS